MQVIMLYYSGLLPFFRIEEDIMGVPVDEVRQTIVEEADGVVHARRRAPE
jgi:hypothetical protein